MVLPDTHHNQELLYEELNKQLKGEEGGAILEGTLKVFMDKVKNSLVFEFVSKRVIYKHCLDLSTLDEYSRETERNEKEDEVSLSCSALTTSLVTDIYDHFEKNSETISVNSKGGLVIPFFSSWKNL